MATDAGAKRTRDRSFPKSAVLPAVLTAVGGFLAARTVVFGTLAPFGAAYLAAASGRKLKWPAAVGVLAGYASLAGSADYLKYIAACAIIIAAGQILRGIVNVDSELFPAILAVAAVGAVGTAFTLGIGASGKAVALLAAEVASAGASAYLLKRLYSRGIRTFADVVFPAALLGAALSGVTAAGISVGRILAAAIAPYIASRAERDRFGLAAVSGLCAGLFADMSAGIFAPFYLPCMALSGLAAGFFSRKGRVFCAVGSALTGVAVVVWASYGSAMEYAAMFELAAGAGLSLLIPDLRALPESVRERASAGDTTSAALSAAVSEAFSDRVRLAAAAKFDALSRAYKSLYRHASLGVAGSPVSRAERSRAALAYSSISGALAAAALDTKRELQLDPISSERLAKCAAARGLTFESAYVYTDRSGRAVAEIAGLSGSPKRGTALPLDDESVSRALERRMQLYSESSDGERPTAVWHEIENLRVSVTTAAARREGSPRSGDAGTWFRLGAKFYMVVSDGAGSGDDAADESAAAVRLTESFIRAGFTAEAAISTVLAADRLRNDGAVFATCDVFEANLITGAAAFYKAGAAQSYLRRADGETEIIPASPAAPNDSADVTRVRVSPGDAVIVLTDGVTEVKPDAKSAAELLASSADRSDDATVAMIRIE